MKKSKKPKTRIPKEKNNRDNSKNQSDISDIKVLGLSKIYAIRSLETEKSNPFQNTIETRISLEKSS